MQVCQERGPERRHELRLRSPISVWFAIRVYMHLNGCIYTFVNACCTATQACEGCMTKLAIFAAVVRDARLATTDTRHIRLKSRQLGEMNGVAYYLVQANS
jgi:hypothetical protein